MTTSHITITAELLDDLQRKAKAATPGPWVEAGGGDFPEHERWVEAGGWSVCSTHSGICGAESQHPNAEHIAAANPATILALVEHIRSLTERLERAEKDAGRYRWLAALASTADTDGAAWDFPWIDAWDYKPGSALNEKYPDIHAAIDAAIAQEGAEHE